MQTGSEEICLRRRAKRERLSSASGLHAAQFVKYGRTPIAELQLF